MAKKLPQISATVSVDVPISVNYIKTAVGRVAVGELSDDVLQEIGEAWTVNLLENAKRQRKEGLENFKPKD